VRQLLIPAPDLNCIKWKQATLARGKSSGQVEFWNSGVKQIERAIADDLAWLAAHPTNRSKGEAIAKRHAFKEAMWERIGEIAASRDLTDEEITPVPKLKHVTGFATCAAVRSEHRRHGQFVFWVTNGPQASGPARSASNRTPGRAGRARREANAFTLRREGHLASGSGSSIALSQARTALRTGAVR
jgi:hypothetical protein